MIISRKEVIKILENIESLTKEDLSKRQIYDELFEIKNKIDRSEKMFALLEKAKSLKMKSFAEEIISEKKKEELKNRSLMTVENITNFYPDNADKSYQQMACGAWVATEGGIYSSESSKVKDLVCHHPIMPIKRLKNVETGEEQITIAFKRDGYWQEITAPKVEIATSRSITNLSRFGVQVNSENAKLLVKYLSDLEMWNSDIIDVQHSTGKLGWHDNTFVPYDLQYVFDGENRFRDLYRSITESGDYFKWVSIIKELRATGRIEARIAIAASFASVLVKPLDALPFIVDFYGQTGGGKTVTINVAASVWGNPAPGYYVGNFRATDTSLETRSDMLNNLPLILDDSKNASQSIRDNYESLIYNLCSGKGKGRSNKELGAVKENTWCNVTICNGENPIGEYSDSGGAINRILEVECNEDIYSDPVKVNDTVTKNYGFAGRVFVGYIKQISKEDLKKMKKEIEQQFSDYNIMQKQLISISILLLADKLATECIFMDGNNLTAEDVKDIPANKNIVSEGQRCYEFILESLEVYGQHFDIQFSVDQWGLPKERDSDGSVYAYFYVTPFENLLRKNGYSRKAFTSWAINRGLIKHSKGRDTFLRREGNDVLRLIAIKVEKELIEDKHNSENNMEFTTVNEQLDIPFS